MLRGAFAWASVTMPNWLDVALLVGLPNRGELKALKASVRNSARNPSRIWNDLNIDRLNSAGTRARTLLHSGSGLVTSVKGLWITQAAGSSDPAQFWRAPVLLLIVQVLNQRLYDVLGSAGSTPVEFAPETEMIPPGNHDTIPDNCHPPRSARVAPLLPLKMGRSYVLLKLYCQGGVPPSRMMNWPSGSMPLF